MNTHSHTGSCCHCPHHRTPIAKEPPAIDPFSANRRDFLTGISALTVGGFMLASAKTAEAAVYAPQRRPVIRQSLKVQPVLTYATPQRREATSWRSWGGIQKEEDALTEKNWISGELEKLRQQAGFPLEFLPVALVKTNQQAAAAAKGDFDVILIYGAGGCQAYC